MNKKNKKAKIALIIVLGVLIVIMFRMFLLTYENNSSVIARHYVKNENIPFLNIGKPISVHNEGPFVVFNYKLNTQKDFNLSGADFLLKYNNGELKGSLDKKGFEKIIYVQKNLCQDKILGNLIKNKNIGARVYFSVKDKNIYQIDTIPFTCKIYNEMSMRARSIKNKGEEYKNEN